jgi:hypothetical protein
MSLRHHSSPLREGVMKFKIGLLLCLTAFCLPTVVDLAHGWDFVWDQGVFNYQYSYATQHGSNGFFGPYNLDASANTASTVTNDYASVNGWLGAQVVSGSEVGTANGSLGMSAALPFNQAVVAVGSYSVANWLVGQSNPSPRWFRWGLQARTPLGTFRYGKFSFRKGNQLQFSRTEEFLTLTVGGNVKPSWQKFWNLFDLEDDLVASYEKGILESRAEVNRLTEYMELSTDDETVESYKALIQTELKKIADNEAKIDKLRQGYSSHLFKDPETNPSLSMTLGFYPWRRQSASYWNGEDLNAIRSANILGELAFTTRNIAISLGTIYSQYHEGAESQLQQSTRETFNSTDTNICEGWIYFNYNNCCGFNFGAEADWYYRTIRNHAAASQAPQYVESWRFMAEAGLVFGPAEIALIYVHMPGPDRRSGVRIDRQPYILATEQKGANVFNDHSLILANAYSGGIGNTNDIPDASTFGIRFNYLLAANLGIGASVLHSERLSHGYGWGYIRPAISVNPTTNGRSLALDFNVRSYPAVNPTSFPKTIPDNDLGWEYRFDLKWELLENWALSIQYAYWKPGKWFNYACIDKSVPDWNIPSDANNWGINPNRSIDPVSVLIVAVNATL